MMCAVRMPLIALGPMGPDQRQLSQSLLLAALLHVLLVLVFGSAPGGQARPGEGVWGRLSVRLNLDEPQAQSGPPHPPPPDQGLAGAGKTRRYGGAVRAADDAAARLPEPGAARQGRWQAEPSPDAQTQALEPTRGDVGAAPPPVERLPEAIRPLAQPALPTLDALPEAPRLPRRLGAVPASPTRAAQPLPALAPAPVAVPELAPLPRLRLPSAQPDTLPRLDRAAPAAIDAVPGLALPEPTTRQLPDSPPMMRPAERLPAAPLPGVSPLPQPLERAPVPPRLMPAAPESALRRSSVAAPPAPLTPATRTATEAPLASAPEIKPLSEPSPVARPDQAGPAASARPEPIAPSVPVAPSLAPVMPPVVSAPVPAGPDAGPRLGHDVATAPSAAASAPPSRLDLSLPRAGELSGRSSRGVLQLMPLPPERKSKLGEGIENAARTDCREAHRDSGLVGGAVIAADALRGKGCRW